MDSKNSNDQENKNSQQTSNAATVDQAAIDAAVEKRLAERDEQLRLQREKEELEAAKRAAEAKKPLVLKHKDEKYEFPGTERGNYIVRHSRSIRGAKGTEIEDPDSVRIQIYRPEVYDDLVFEDEKLGKQNAFVQQGEKSIVLHDPTK